MLNVSISQLVVSLQCSVAPWAQGSPAGMDSVVGKEMRGKERSFSLLSLQGPLKGGIWHLQNENDILARQKLLFFKFGLVL